MKSMYLFCAIMGAAIIALAADAPTKPNDTFVITLTDGSKLLCKPALEKVPLKTSFADVEIPRKRIQKITLNKKTGKATLHFINKDKLQGTLKIDSIKGKTLLGDITFKLKDVTEILSSIRVAPVYKDSLYARNRCINNLRQIDSGKEQWAMANNIANNGAVNTNGVNDYIKGGTTPTCPAGGHYIYHPIGKNPTCVVPGHVWGH